MWLSIVPFHDVGGSSGSNYSILVKEIHYFQGWNSNGDIQNYQRDRIDDEHFFITCTKSIDIVDFNSNGSYDIFQMKRASLPQYKSSSNSANEKRGDWNQKRIAIRYFAATFLTFQL